MSPLQQSALTSADSWSRLEPILEQFEEAWLQGGQPDLEDYIPPDEPEREVLIHELAHADLECRIKAGLAARVETYVDRFPELAQASTRVIELIATEFELRRRKDASLSVEEYVRRFPQYREELSSRLSDGQLPGPEAPPTHLDCPGCHNTIPLAGDAAARNLVCPSCGYGFRVDTGHVRPGLRSDLTRLGKFVLEGIVGQGAFGTVYRARDTELDRTVAVKVPRAAWTSAEEEERFFREAKAAARLSHPGIVPIHDLGRADNCPYIVSGFVEGETLSDQLKERRFSFRQAASLLCDVADAVEYAHEHNVIHRDLKPSNIMLGRLVSAANGAAAPQTRSERMAVEQKPIVMDFGLARQDDGEVHVTVDGQVLGTPAYMSPEQARGHGRAADARSDVYSLGVILYELLTGELPFRGVAQMMLLQIQYDEPRPPRRLNDRIPRDLETITLKCLEKEPTRRYPRAAALAEDLRRYLSDQPIQARPIGRLERTWRWTRRNRWPAAALVLLSVLATSSSAGTFYVLHQKQLAVQAQGEAVQAQGEAEERLQLSMDTIHDVVFDMQEKLAGKPDLAELREGLLQTAKQGVDRIAQTTKQHEAGLAAAIIHLRQGDLDRALGSQEQALEQYRRSYTIAESIREAFPENVGALAVLRDTHMVLGDTSRSMGKSTEAKEEYERALTLARAVASEKLSSTRDMWVVARVLLRLGDACIGQGDFAAARKCFHEGRDIARQLVTGELGNPWLDERVRVDLARAYEKLGEVGLRTKDLPAARENCLKALDAANELLAAHPKSIEARRCRAGAWELLGDVSLGLGDPASAETYYRSSLGAREDLVKRDPLRASHEHMLALAYARLGDVQGRLGNVEAGQGHFKKAIAQFEDYLAGASRDARARLDLSGAQERLGLLHRRLGNYDDARALFLKVLKFRDDLARLDAKSYEPRYTLTLGLANLGLVEVDRLDFPAAEKWFGQALQVLEQAEKEGLVRDPKRHQGWVAYQRNKLALCQAMPQALASLEFVLAQPAPLVPDLLRGRARALAARGNHADAAATVVKLLQVGPKDVNNLVEVAMIYGRCTGQVGKGKPPDALSPEELKTRTVYHCEALSALGKAVAGGYRDLGKLSTHVDLEPLRQEKEFQNLLATVRERIQAKKPVD